MPWSAATHQPRVGPASHPTCEECVNKKKGCFFLIGSETCDYCKSKGKQCRFSAQKTKKWREGLAKDEELLASHDQNVDSAPAASGSPQNNLASSSSLPQTTTTTTTTTEVNRMPPKSVSAETRREPSSFVTEFYCGDFCVDMSSADAYKTFVSGNGFPKMPFTKGDIKIAAIKAEKDPTYWENLVYPFRAAKAKTAAKWAQQQGGKHGLGTVRFVNAEWTFDKDYMVLDTPETNVENQVGQPILCGGCCAAKDDDKNFSIYHALLNNFAVHLMAKSPVTIIKGSRFQDGGEDVYSTYKYFFNTLSWEKGSTKSSKTPPILRRFACNSLSGNDVAELEFEDHPPMALELQDDTDAMCREFDWDDFLVRLPGVNFGCKTHEKYAKTLVYWVRFHPAGSVEHE